MGTNYYWRKEACEHCHRVERSYHIGKSSVGWTFSFEGYLGDGDGPLTRPLVSAADWREVLALPGCIVDEYGGIITPEKFWEFVEAKKQPWGVERKLPLNHTQEYGRGNQNWLDPEGNSFSGYGFS